MQQIVFTVNKSEHEEKLTVGSYLLAFNTECENHLFVNFKTENDVQQFVKTHTLLYLYDEWLDYIGNSEVYASEIEDRKAYICKITSESFENYTVEVVSVVY